MAFLLLHNYTDFINSRVYKIYNDKREVKMGGRNEVYFVFLRNGTFYIQQILS